jgi:hypothetical protein
MPWGWESLGLGCLGHDAGLALQHVSGQFFGWDGARGQWSKHSWYGVGTAVGAAVEIRGVKPIISRAMQAIEIVNFIFRKWQNAEYSWVRGDQKGDGQRVLLFKYPIKLICLMAVFLQSLRFISCFLVSVHP